MSAALRCALAAVVLLMLALPMWLSSYGISFCVGMFMSIAIAGSWNLFSGTTGYASLGHGIFFGIGAYTFAVSVVLLKLHPALAFVLTAAVPGVVALVMGFVLLTTRIRIAYFAIVMLGFNEIVKTVFANIKAIGSANGLTLPPMPSNLIAYYFLLALAVAIPAATYAISRSRVGLGLRAIVADEVAAETVGIGTVAHKMAMFVLSAVLLGLTGGMIAWYWSYIDPYMAFDLAVSFDMLVMAVFGGVGTVLGPVLGAVVMTVFKEALSTSIPQFHTIIFGAIVIVLIIWRPGGVIEVFSGLRAGKQGRANAGATETAP
jgi:branched-chain amino acid transport system permease protein